MIFFFLHYNDDQDNDDRHHRRYNDDQVEGCSLYCPRWRQWKRLRGEPCNCDDGDGDFFEYIY